MLVKYCVRTKNCVPPCKESWIIANVWLMMKEVVIALGLAGKQPEWTPWEWITAVCIYRLKAPYCIPAKHCCSMHSYIQKCWSNHHRQHITDYVFKWMCVDRCKTISYLVLMVNLMYWLVDPWLMKRSVSEVEHKVLKHTAKDNLGCKYDRTWHLIYTCWVIVWKIRYKI